MPMIDFGCRLRLQCVFVSDFGCLCEKEIRSAPSLEHHRRNDRFLELYLLRTEIINRRPCLCRDGSHRGCREHIRIGVIIVRRWHLFNSQRGMN